ncbi:MAG: hypothetical protein QF464_07640, partial [Myxococcota bacterium]|nr:hypothetical protein [Myxococcota bacterium]
RALNLPSAGDVVTLDTHARALQGAQDGLAAALTAGHPGLVQQVTVAGETVVDDGRHVAL